MNNTGNSSKTIYQLLTQSAENFGHEPALTYLQEISPKFVDETISYLDLLGNINRTVRLIRDRLGNIGEKRPVVSFMLPSLPETHYILWAAESVGIANPLNPLMSVDALTALTAKAETDIIFSLGPNPHSDLWEKAQAVAARLPNKPKLIPVTFSGNGDNDLFDKQLENYSDAALPTEWLSNSEDISAYFHTGGTTNTPKLAMLTQANQMYTANACLILCRLDWVTWASMGYRFSMWRVHY